jgi:uncharacterized protein YdeI (YjbR/CyaY-like superfamily)
MGKKDSRVDAYIKKSAEFSRPIMLHLRELVHQGCPEAEETIKWGVPHFVYKGMLCSIAAFKQHCAFGFWKGKLMASLKADDQQWAEAWGQYGRLTSLDDLPPDKVILKQVKEAAKLNDDGVKAPPQRKAKEKAPLIVPPDFKKLLKASPAAQTTFDGFTYSHKKEYLEWIIEAKTDATRQRRMASAIELLAEGKSRNWKYQNC